MKKLIITLFILALGVGLTGRAYAGTAGTTMNVSANLLASCTVSTTSITFPDYDGSSGVFGNGDVMVNCPASTPYNIAMDGGLNYDAQNGILRNVSDGAGNYILYTFYQDSAYTTLWGDSDYDNTYTSGASLADTGTGASQPHTVYGVIASPPSGAPAGAYSDTVNVTVYY